MTEPTLTQRLHPDQQDKKPTFYDYLLAQPSEHSSPEKAQALTRIVICACVTVGMLSYELIAGFQGSAAVLTASVLLPAYLFVSVVLFANVASHPGQFAGRHHLAIFLDHGVISWGMYALGPSAAQFYPFYLWVTIGNGLRFGIYYLHIATLISAMGFLSAILLNQEWFEQAPLALGLLGGMIIIPIFFTTLLRQLQTTDERLARKIDESHYQATHDALTDLPNRVLLEDRLNHAISKASRSGDMLALLFIDSDNFKSINDSLGHPTGDDLLRQLALRLESVLRAEDTLARLGGDEFIVILERHVSSYGAAEFAKRLLEAVSGYYQVGQQEVFVTVSIGIALYPFDGQTSEYLMQNADTAMYRAKDEGGNCYRIYDRKMSENITERLSLGMEMRKAFADNQFILYFQPIVEAVSGNLVAAEALLRWRHPEQGILPPAKFISLLEDSDLIFPVGLWVIEDACRALRNWDNANLPGLSISVNVSARQFWDSAFPDKVGAILTRTSVRAERLRLEITEGVLIDRSKQIEKQFLRLKAMGIVLSLDDFGTGYSSLGYLKRFPIGTLKVDRSFVKDLPHDMESCALVNSILAIGENLGIKVIAEGVESIEQVNWMRAAGCDYLQGFYFGRPMPSEDLVSGYQTQKASGFSA